MITYNNNEVNAITYNGVTVNQVYYNGVLVWPDGETIFSGGDASSFIYQSSYFFAQLGEFGTNDGYTWTPQTADKIQNTSTGAWDDFVGIYNSSEKHSLTNGIKGIMSSWDSGGKIEGNYVFYADHPFFITNRSNLLIKSDQTACEKILIDYTCSNQDMGFYIGVSDTHYTNIETIRSSRVFDYVFTRYYTTSTSGRAIITQDKSKSYLTGKYLAILMFPIQGNGPNPTRSSGRTLTINKIMIN